MTSAEYRCFIGGLSWNTTDEALESAFQPYGPIRDAKVVIDRETNRSRGFGFITFESAEGMDSAIQKMNGTDLDGRAITVTKAQDKSGGRDRERDRDFGDRRGSGAGGECFKCGSRGHWARDCTNRGGRDRSDRVDRERDRERERSSDRYRGGEDRYRGGEDRYESRGGGGRSDRSDRSDRYSSRDNGRDNGRGRSGPYDRPSNGGRYSNGGSRDDRY